MKIILSLFAFGFTLFSQNLFAAEFDSSHGSGVLRKEFQPSAVSSSVLYQSYQLMVTRGGNVLHESKTMAIFWGSEWNTPSFAKDKISGISDFFDGYGGSNYANVSTEYKDRQGYISAQSSFLGAVIDSSAAPTTALTVAGAVAEACKIANDQPDPEGIYFIYTSTRPGAVRFCAWHGAGSCTGGAKIQVAYMPNVDSYRGCQTFDAVTGHSSGLATLANLTAHELAETITDPRINAWYDIYNQEIGDKCAWSFSSTNPISTFSNGSQWKLQMLWSNAAYKAGKGEPNYSGLKGCVLK